MVHHLLTISLLVAALLAPLSASSQGPSTHALPDPGRTSVVIGGDRFGAAADEDGPLGGGAGYRRTLSSGDFVTRDLSELLSALVKAKAPQVVFIPGEVVLDCSARVLAERLVIEIPAGVTLASDRGVDGSRGAIIRSSAFATRPLIRATGPGVRICGLRLEGPDPDRRLDHWRRAFREGKGREYYYALPVSDAIIADADDLEVDNCELLGWSHAAVWLPKGKGHRVHHCWIHHNQRKGLGYGIAVGRARARIDHCLFDWNRHSIAGTGHPGSGYEAHDNVELGTSLSHCFDMHGGRDRQDGTDIAGAEIHIHHNTFRSQARAIAIRGVPEREARIESNWFRHPAGDDRVLLGGGERTVLTRNAHGMPEAEVAEKR